MYIRIKFEESAFDDMPRPEKDANDLAVRILEDAGGNIIDFSPYNNIEINRCARKLIELGLLRGAIIGKDNCVWSKPTPRGYRTMKSFRKKENS